MSPGGTRFDGRYSCSHTEIDGPRSDPSSDRHSFALSCSFVPFHGQAGSQEAEGEPVDHHEDEEHHDHEEEHYDHEEEHYDHEEEGEDEEFEDYGVEGEEEEFDEGDDEEL